MIQPRYFLLVLGLTALVGCGSEDPGGGASFRRASSRSGTATDRANGANGTGTSAGNAGNTGKGTGSGAPTGNGSNSGSNGGAAATTEQACVDAINAHRATDGLPALQRWTEQEGCASDQAESDARSNRAHGAFGRCQEMGQNECPGWDGPADTMIRGCLDAMWKEGPGGGHHDAMASREYTEVSCGFSTGPNGEVWSVQNFR